MLDREKVLQALDEKRDQFRLYETAQATQQDLARELLSRFSRLDFDTVATALAELDVAWPGARPTLEFDQAKQLRMPFSEKWPTHEEARAWALEVLRDRPVIAVDGSQITPTKDYSIAVGAVQVGWFVNYHVPGGRYIKDVEFEVLGPDELAALDDGTDAAGGGFPNWLVNQKRFVGECRRLCVLMAEHAHLPASQRPVCFLDGSLIISFAGQMHPARAQPYIDAVSELLACSERYQVPLVAYVDTSFSHDLMTLVQIMTDTAGAPVMSDASLLGSQLPDWGDRSPLFLCARLDELSRDGRASFYNDVGFAYLRIVQERPPVRIEVPRWILDSDMTESVLDVVRAECVVGTGYPYAIETADALSVITQQDRQRFFALWQRFMERQNIHLTLARKAGSKQGRR